MEIQLFYTNQSPHCKTFIQQLYTNKNLFERTTKINIQNYRNNLPPNLKRVPAILIKKVNPPSANLYQGTQAFEWLKQMTQTQRQQLPPQHQMQQPQQQQPQQPNFQNPQANTQIICNPSLDGRVSAFDPAQSSGKWSDNFLDFNQQENPNPNNTGRHYFQSANSNMPQMTMHVAQGDGGLNQNSRQSNNMQSDIDRAQMMRDNDPYIKRPINRNAGNRLPSQATSIRQGNNKFAPQ